MVAYITVLRALSTLLITNSHYTGVYPTDLIANGGLLGNILFFAISGFCLCNVRAPFPGWYAKRIVRIYPPVLIATLVYMALGLYAVPNAGIIGSGSVVWWFLYPTVYHFVASIIVLYIPFYIVLRIKKCAERLPLVMGCVFVIYMAVYLFLYDKNFYHIDAVGEPMIRFLFFEAMLLGAYFRRNHARYINQNRLHNWAICIVLTVLYFASKLFFTRYGAYSAYQCVNQILLFILLYYLLRCFAGIESPLSRIPKSLSKVVNYLADITLEIYVVQIPIIVLLRSFAPFPLNWLAVTALIFAAASLLHLVSKRIKHWTDPWFRR